MHPIGQLSPWFRRHFHHPRPQKFPLNTFWAIPPPPSSLANSDLLPVPMILFFPECHIDGIRQCAAVCIYLLSLSITYLGPIPVVARSSVDSFSPLSNISFCVYTAVTYQLPEDQHMRWDILSFGWLQGSHYKCLWTFSCGRTFFFLWVKYHRVGTIWIHGKYRFNFTRNA